MDEFLDEAKDLWVDLCENYSDPYWWADHPTLRMAGLSIVAGGLGLVFHYLQLRMTRSMIGDINAPR